MNLWAAREVYPLPEPQPLLPEVFGEGFTTTRGERPLAIGVGIEALLSACNIAESVRQEVYAGGHRDDRGNIVLDMGEGRTIYIERGGPVL